MKVGIAIIVIGLGLEIAQGQTPSPESWQMLSSPQHQDCGDAAPIPEKAKSRQLMKNLSVASVSQPTVRIGYIVPSNRTPQPDAEAKLAYVVRYMQAWYRSEMERHGFGPKTFRYETTSDGVTPKVHVVKSTLTDDYMRGDVWGRTIQAASAGGLSTWATGELWFLVPECHLLTSDGTVTGGVALGASWGSGPDPGIAMMGGDSLARWNPRTLSDDRPYNGLVLAELGQFPMAQNKSFPWFEGTTMSEVSSSVLGAAIHELGHAFGLPHDFRNDANFRGNIMGNGCRGYRGNRFPGKYANHYARLSYAAALALNRSRYFNAGTGDTTKPSITATTSGSATASGGCIEIPFTATDASGLAAYWVSWGGDLVAEGSLQGTNSSIAVRTPYFDAGTTSNKTYTISVFDVFGNKTNLDVTRTVGSTTQTSLRPAIRITPQIALPGELVTLQESDTLGTIGVAYEWDTDGDGVFESPTGQSASFSFIPAWTGARMVRVRTSRSSGEWSQSTPVPLYIHRPTQLYEWGTNSFAVSWRESVGLAYEAQGSTDLRQPWKVADGGTSKAVDGRTLNTIPQTGSAAYYRVKYAKDNGTLVTVPDFPASGSTVTIVYDPAGRSLANASQVYIHFAADDWANRVTPRPAMQLVDGRWIFSYAIPPGSKVLKMVFTENAEVQTAGLWDNNNWTDWSLPVGLTTAASN
jgi:hypothetical protein